MTFQPGNAFAYRFIPPEAFVGARLPLSWVALRAEFGVGGQFEGLSPLRSDAGDLGATAVDTAEHMQDTIPLSASNFSCRTITRVTLGGSAVRLHLSNRFATTPITFGAVTVAAHAGSGALDGPPLPVTFGGQRAVTLAGGAEVVSDPVALAVTADTQLAVSDFIPGAISEVTEHQVGDVTQYCTPFDGSAGDHTGDADASSFSGHGSNVPWLAGVDVSAAGSDAALAAFGDSLTDGYLATLDGYSRYPDALAARLQATATAVSVVNMGISANRIVAAGGAGPAGQTRFAHDVLVLVKVIGATLIPRHDGWGGADDAKDAVRASVNSWIRSASAFDAVADFDAQVKNTDPNYPATHTANYQDYLASQYDAGDHIHLTPAGYAQLAAAVPVPLP